jgi:hypothetical protein
MPNLDEQAEDGQQNHVPSQLTEAELKRITAVLAPGESVELTEKGLKDVISQLTIGQLVDKAFELECADYEKMQTALLEQQLDEVNAELNRRSEFSDACKQAEESARPGSVHNYEQAYMQVQKQIYEYVEKNEEYFGTLIKNKAKQDFKSNLLLQAKYYSSKPGPGWEKLRSAVATLVKILCFLPMLVLSRINADFYRTTFKDQLKEDLAKLDKSVRRSIGPKKKTISSIFSSDNLAEMEASRDAQRKKLEKEGFHSQYTSFKSTAPAGPVNYSLSRPGSWGL